MDERTLQVLTAITLLLIGIFFVFGNILRFFGTEGSLNLAVSNALSWLIFLFSLATAAVLISDALRRREENE